MSTTETKKGAEIYLSLGSNLGERDANVRKAIKLLSEKITLLAVSQLEETIPVDYEDQPKFINCVARGHTYLSPQELLLFAKGIEKEMGRVKTFRYGPRTIDVDILFYGNKTVKDEGLTIPHPKVAEREFILSELAEIAPDLVHPVLKVSIKKLLANHSGKVNKNR